MFTDEIEKKIYNILEDMHRYSRQPKEALERIKELFNKEGNDVNNS